ncbi:SPOR domain-containing protein [Burkholderiaceae bacterium UC74_6]
MLRKLLLLVVLLAFAAVAFLAGLLAPRSWQQSTQALLSSAPGVVAAASSAASSAAASASAAAASAPTSAASATIIPRAQLWADSAAAPGQRYALLAGQFPTEAAARALAANVQQHGIGVRQLTVREADNSLSWLVAIGLFESEALALEKAPALAGELNLSAPLPVLVLPAAPK